MASDRWQAKNRDRRKGQQLASLVTLHLAHVTSFNQRVQASGSSIGSYPVFQYYDAFGNLGYHGDTVTWDYAPFPPVNGKVYGKYYGNTLFIHSNALGSTGTTTRPDGSWVSSEIYDPWGQRWATSGSLLDERFAGIDNVRDPESGLDQTPNRMLSFGYGRWLTPDPLAGDVTNPQSLNRYAYVMNNPINLTDVLGLGSPYGPTAPPCGGPGQISCEQYFSPIGPASGVCPAEFSGCYATLGGPTIGINGTSATAFTINPPTATNGGPCTSYAQETIGCNSVAPTIVALGTVTTGQPTPIFTGVQGPSGPGGKAGAGQAESVCGRIANQKAQLKVVDAGIGAVKTLIKNAEVGFIGGAVTGCLVLSEVGCVEGAVPGASVGFLGGTLLGTASGANEFIMGLKEAATTLGSDVVDCEFQYSIFHP